MKKFILILLLFVILLMTISCASESKKDHFELTFSEYYQKAEDYENISILISDYFECIQYAYEKSDKVNLSSFSLPKDYKDISNKLSEINNSSSFNISKRYLIKLQLLEPYLQMESYLSERDVLMKSSVGNGQGWYMEVKKFLDNIYNEYRNRCEE